MKPMNDQDFQKTEEEFVRPLAILIGLFLFVHLLPKSETSYSNLRLIFTVVYFGSLIALCWHLMKPREHYMEERFHFRFEEAPKQIQVAGQTFLHSLSAYVKLLCFVLILFLSANALNVLGSWFPLLTDFQLLINLAWWIGGIALLGVLIGGWNQLEQVVHFYRDFKLQQQLHPEFTPKGDTRLQMESRTEPVQQENAPVEEILKAGQVNYLDPLRWVVRSFLSFALILLSYFLFIEPKIFGKHRVAEFYWWMFP